MTAAQTMHSFSIPPKSRNFDDPKGTPLIPKKTPQKTSGKGDASLKPGFDFSIASLLSLFGRCDTPQKNT